MAPPPWGGAAQVPGDTRAAASRENHGTPTDGAAPPRTRGRAETDLVAPDGCSGCQAAQPESRDGTCDRGERRLAGAPRLRDDRRGRPRRAVGVVAQDVLRRFLARGDTRHGELD